MSKINYQALRMAAENATPGEWCSDDYYGVIADAGLNANYYIASCSGPDNRANKRFIAAANPATVLALLDEREAQSKRIAELTDALTQMINAHKTTIRFGHERITECGGECDSPEKMISENPDIRMAEAVLRTGIKTE
ncbi:ead/Ea22-like family protein [Escherichia coli]|nr:ead/Ea22-like family protein [Escherichia coli]HAW0235020.1 ead/Ea22-like family protein [Escherichia coli]HBB2303793.1 ead/Ea22-like family protein [Escherichia coli]